MALPWECRMLQGIVHWDRGMSQAPPRSTSVCKWLFELCFTQSMYLEGWWDEEMRGISDHSLYVKKEDSLFHFPIILSSASFPGAWFGAQCERGKGCGLCPSPHCFGEGNYLLPHLGKAECTQLGLGGAEVTQDEPCSPPQHTVQTLQSQ